MTGKRRRREQKIVLVAARGIKTNSSSIQPLEHSDSIKLLVTTVRVSYIATYLILHATHEDDMTGKRHRREQKIALIAARGIKTNSNFNHDISLPYF